MGLVIGACNRALFNVARVFKDAAIDPAADFGVDFRAASERRFELLDENRARAFAGDRAVAPRVERPARRRVGRYFAILNRLDEPQAVNPGSRRAHEHNVGAARPDRFDRVAERARKRRLPVRYVERGAEEFVVDGNVARRHIGEIFQLPDRRHFRQTVFTPVRTVEDILARFVLLTAGGHRLNELLRGRNDIVRRERDAPAGGFVRVAEVGVEQRLLGRGDAQLNLARHELEPFANRLLFDVVELSEILNLAGEAVDRGDRFDRVGFRF